MRSRSDQLTRREFAKLLGGAGLALSIPGALALYQHERVRSNSRMLRLLAVSTLCCATTPRAESTRSRPSSVDSA